MFRSTRLYNALPVLAFLLLVWGLWDFHANGNRVVPLDLRRLDMGIVQPPTRAPQHEVWDLHQRHHLPGDQELDPAQQTYGVRGRAGYILERHGDTTLERRDDGGWVVVGAAP